MIFISYTFIYKANRQTTVVQAQAPIDGALQVYPGETGNNLFTSMPASYPPSNFSPSCTEQTDVNTAPPSYETLYQQKQQQHQPQQYHKSDLNSFY